MIESSLYWLLLVAVGVIVAPVLIYYLARAATAGYYHGKRLARKMNREDLERDNIHNNGESNG